MFWLFYIILLILVIVCCLIGLTTMDQVSEVEYKSLLSKSRFAKSIIFILLLLFTIVAPIYLAVKYYSNLNILPFGSMLIPEWDLMLFLHHSVVYS